jgi:2-polyprenyl-3-methyl-5-hydroxy-6-metoxy-1,4-benzoquinol methylase
MALSKYDIEVDLEHRQGTSHAHLIEMVGANKRVLDVGCDTGYLGEALAAFGNRTSGVEVNQVTASEARKRLENVAVGDLERMDLIEIFGRGAFDVVIFGDVLEHLRDPLPVLRQSRGLLAPGGSVLVSLPNVAHGDIRLALLHGRFRYTNVGILDETHTKFFTRDTLVEFLHDAGFVLVELRRTFAALFSTEVGVREEDYPPDVVAALREDEEATTYQFVVRAVPDDVTAVESAQALRVDQLSTELSAARRRLAEATAERDRLAESERTVAELTGERDRLTAEAQALAAEHNRLSAACDEATRQRDHLEVRVAQLEQELEVLSERLSKSEHALSDERATLAALNQTFTMRAVRVPRAIYGRLRTR